MRETMMIKDFSNSLPLNETKNDLTSNSKIDIFDLKDQLHNTLVHSQKIIIQVNKFVKDLESISFDTYSSKNQELSLDKIVSYIMCANLEEVSS